MPVSKKKDLPSTVQRSPAKAQRTYAKAHDSAVETYGEGERAHRTAYSALKHSFERRGDHWEPKDRKGPSDPQAKKSTPESRRRPSRTYGGVDVEGNSKQELYERAKQYGVEGRSSMSKQELAEAIAKKQKSGGRKR
jgi:cation transport regulator ChaB